MNNQIVLVGAEKQSAVSIALAYPEFEFLFVSLEPIIDGWDLNNVTIVSYEKFTSEYDRRDNVYILNSKFYNTFCAIKGQQYRLSTVCSSFLSDFKDYMLPVYNNITDIPFEGNFIIKGDLFHKQDATEVVNQKFKMFSEDTFGCHYIFQEYLQSQSTYMVVGNRNALGGILLSIFKIYRESNAREDVLLAGETISSKFISDVSIAIVEKMSYNSLFAFNCIESKNKILFTSFRPEPKAVFQTLRRAGYDLLNYNAKDRLIAKPGLKFIANINYTSYSRTSA